MGFPAVGGDVWGAPGTLSINNGVFALNGVRKFLMFGSYFGGLRDAILHPDWLIVNFDNAKPAIPANWVCQPPVATRIRSPVGPSSCWTSRGRRAWSWSWPLRASDRRRVV